MIKKWFLLLVGCLAFSFSARALDLAASKAAAITLPDLAYRDLPLKDILEDIRQKGVAADPEGVGVNLLVKLDEALAAKRFTLSVKAPTVERALKLLAAVAGLYLQYEPAYIVIAPSERMTAE